MPKRAPTTLEKLGRDLVALEAALDDPLVSAFLRSPDALQGSVQSMTGWLDQDNEFREFAEEIGSRIEDSSYFRPCSDLFCDPAKLPKRFAVVRPISLPEIRVRTVSVRFQEGACETVVNALNNKNALKWDACDKHPFRRRTEVYLFGKHLWVLEKADLGLERSELDLRFISAAFKQQKQIERLEGRAAGLLNKRESQQSKVADRDFALVWARDGGQCVQCGSKVDLTIDHIVPQIMGGPNTPENLQILCRLCNSEKGSQI